MDFFVELCKGVTGIMAVLCLVLGYGVTLFLIEYVAGGAAAYLLFCAILFCAVFPLIYEHFNYD